VLLGRSREMVCGCEVHFSFGGKWAEVDVWIANCDSQVCE
jgi:hypothetical protein